MVRRLGKVIQRWNGRPGITIALLAGLLAAGVLIIVVSEVVRRHEPVDGVAPEKHLTSGGGILRNSGFEGTYAGAAPFWKVNSWGNPAPTFSVERETRSGHVHNGRSAQLFRVGSFGGGAAELIQSFEFHKGHTYRASVWIKASKATPVTIMLRRDAGYPWKAYAIMTVQANTAWQQVTIRGSSPTNESGSFRIAPKQSDTTLWVDDASLTDVTPPPGGTLASFSSDPIPHSYFGVHANQLGWTHNEWPTGGQGMLRLWDTAVNWPQLEKSNGSWDWKRMDYLVNQAQKNDVDVMYTLGLTPQWAASDATKTGSYENSSTSPPAKMEDWRDYVRTVATRYKGKIKYYEIWNEPDYKGFYSGDVAKMVEMSRVAYEELKQLDPNIVLISPGLSDGQGMYWLDEYLFKGGGKYVDVIGYHWKFDLSPEDTTLRIDNVRELMENHGVAGKPLFNTEGAAMKDPASPPSVNETRGSVARAFVLFWAHGVSNLNWFAWDIQVPDRVSLSEPDDRTPTSAGIAYRQTVDWLHGARMIELSTHTDGTYVAEIARADGYRGWIVWNGTRSRTFTIPASWGLMAKRDLAGGRANIAGVTSVRIGPAPILLENPNHRS